MKKKISLVLALVMIVCAVCFSGCGSKSALDTTKIVSEYSKELEGTELNVFNWGEYISDGAEGSLNVNKEFEKLTGIKVNYTNYESNEVMYSKLAGGGASYDIIIPSDYMIERLLNENMIQKIDFSNIPNYKYISDEYKSLYFDLNNEYSVPYSVGMVGLIYNTTMVEGTPASWSVMWDAKYKNQVLMFNNSRDTFGISQYLLGQDVNTTSADDWNKAFEKLKEQKPLVQSYVMDEVFGKMESGEAAMCAYYAGDFLSMQENNPDLAFVYPDEGTNIFVDSFCIPVSAQNKKAAEMYINFMLEPEIALANAEATWYATPNTAVVADSRYEQFSKNEVLYPTEEVKTQYFHNLDKDTLALLSKFWDELKLA